MLCQKENILLCNILAVERAFKFYSYSPYSGLLKYRHLCDAFYRIGFGLIVLILLHFFFYICNLLMSLLVLEIQCKTAFFCPVNCFAYKEKKWALKLFLIELPTEIGVTNV